MTQTQQPVTGKDLKAGLEIIKAVADAIRELGRVPSGHLYARLAASGCTFENYEKIISIIKNTGLVRETPGHELVWIGEGGAK